MTAGTLSDMINKCKENTAGHSMTCSLNENECAYFDIDGTLIYQPYPLNEGSSYRFAIQPTSLWYFNDCVGVTWYIKQVRRIVNDNDEDMNEMSDWSL